MGIFNFLRKVKHNENNEDNLREKVEIIDNNKDNYSEINIDISNLKKEIEDNFEEQEENIEKVKLTQEEIDELISSEILRIIDLYDNFEDVKSAAYEAAKNIGKENIKDIPKFLSGKMHRPTRYINKYIAIFPFIF